MGLANKYLHCYFGRSGFLLFPSFHTTTPHRHNWWPSVPPTQTNFYLNDIPSVNCLSFLILIYVSYLMYICIALRLVYAFEQVHDLSLVRNFLSKRIRILEGNLVLRSYLFAFLKFRYMVFVMLLLFFHPYIPVCSAHSVSSSWNAIALSRLSWPFNVSEGNGFLVSLPYSLTRDVYFPSSKNFFKTQKTGEAEIKP